MKSLILAGAVALAAPAYAQGAAAVGPPVSVPPAAPAAPESVSRASVQQTDKDRFAEMDANKDGFVTAAELGAAAGPERAAQIVGSLDSNKDGKVSLAELDSMMLGMFDKADSNHDGMVSAQEQAAMAAARRGN